MRNDFLFIFDWMICIFVDKHECTTIAVKGQGRWTEGHGRIHWWNTRVCEGTSTSMALHQVSAVTKWFLLHAWCCYLFSFCFRSDYEFYTSKTSKIEQQGYVYCSVLSSRNSCCDQTIHNWYDWLYFQGGTTCFWKAATPGLQPANESDICRTFKLWSSAKHSSECSDRLLFKLRQLA